MAGHCVFDGVHIDCLRNQIVSSETQDRQCLIYDRPEGQSARTSPSTFLFLSALVKERRFGDNFCQVPKVIRVEQSFL